MSHIRRFLSWPGAPFLTILIGAVGQIAIGVIMTEVFRLAACPLCVIQRMLYLLLAVLAVPGLLLLRSVVARRLVAFGQVATSATGVFVAGYQTWLQRFPSTAGCSGYQTWWEELVDWAGDKLPLLFQSDGICSEAGWIFLSLSIAEWSLICFLGYLAISLYSLLTRR